MKLPQYQKDALLTLRTMLNPDDPQNAASVEVKACLRALSGWLSTYVLPSIDAMDSSSSYGDRWLREAVSGRARQIRLAQGRGAHSLDRRTINQK